MPHTKNTAIETQVQVLDGSKNAVTAATVSYIVYDEADASFQSGNMAHFANGIYSISWTPDNDGEWTFYAYSSNPKFKETWTYTIYSVSDDITVRKNSGADVGSRPRLNFIEGANVTLTVADDAGNAEVDITIASNPNTSYLNHFETAPNPDSYKGTYATMMMADTVDTLIRMVFIIPEDIVTITTAVVVIIPNDTGNIRWNVSTNFAKLCNNEDYQTHTDSIAATDSGVTADELECLDITGALTGALGEDIVGLEFTREGSHANDTIGDSVHFIGVYIEGDTA